MTVILALDTAHYSATGLHTLYNRPLGLSFTFHELEAMEAFLLAWYHNPISAQFAYNAIQERQRQS